MSEINQKAKIEKGIQVPEIYRGAKSKYPFDELEIGDSFFVYVKQQTMCSVSYGFGKRHNKKFTTRSENGGTRVWRIE